MAGPDRLRDAAGTGPEVSGGDLEDRESPTTSYQL